MDGINAQGYFSNGLALPQTSNFFVGRIDHDFGEKWKFMSSYRYYDFTQLVSTQVDIGGVLSGDKAGTPPRGAPPREALFLVCRSHHHAHPEYHQRFPLRLSA